MMDMIRSPIGNTPMFRPEKSSPPMMSEMSGLMISLTSAVTMAVNAPPTTTPTARSMTLPREMNTLNSSSQPGFFMMLPPLFSLSFQCLGTRTSVPPMYERSTSGMTTLPSGCRLFSRNAMSIRGGATQVLLSVWAR